MAYTDDDMRALERIFVTRAECEKRTDESQRDRAEIKSDVRECRTMLKMLIGILAAIAAPVVSIAVKLLFS